VCKTSESKERNNPLKAIQFNTKAIRYLGEMGRGMVRRITRPAQEVVSTLWNSSHAVFGSPQRPPSLEAQRN
jgi:hypothetical protein